MVECGYYHKQFYILFDFMIFDLDKLNRKKIILLNKLV